MSRRKKQQSALRVARVAAGYTQEELSKRTRTSQIFVSRLERGGSARITPKIVARFAQALGIPPEMIFEDSER